MDKKILKDVEKRLIDIELEKAMRIHNISEEYIGSWEQELEIIDITRLDDEKRLLKIKRQFLLDKKARTLFWW